MQIKQKINVGKGRTWGVRAMTKQKKYPVRNRNGVRSSSQRDLLAPISNYKKTNQAPTAIDKKKKNYFN